MQPWITFYVALTGASATLLGLLFVSVSVNAKLILGEGHAHARRLAEQAFQNYLLVLLISLLAFVPELTPYQFAMVSLFLALFRGVLIVPRIYLTIAAPDVATRKTFRRYIATVIGFGMLLYAFIGILLGRNDMVLAGSGMIVLVIAATVSAWDLLVRVAETKKTGD